MFAKARGPRGAAPAAKLESSAGAMVGGPRAWTEGNLNEFALDLPFFDLADIDEQPVTGDALVEQLRTTGPTVSSTFDPTEGVCTEMALAGCCRFPNAYVTSQVIMWPDKNLPERKLPSNNIVTSTSTPRTLEEHLIREYGWARAKAAADDAWRSAAAKAVDLAIRKALLVCQDEFWEKDNPASDAWGWETWRPLLYLADAVGIEEKFIIRTVPSYVLGSRPELAENREIRSHIRPEGVRDEIISNDESEESDVQPSDERDGPL